MNATAPSRDRLLIAAIVVIAVLLRSVAAIVDSFYYDDEIGQYIEQAHRIVFGFGTIPWEYHFGMRNWLIPLFLTPSMALGNLIAPQSDLYLVLPRLCMAFASLPILWAAFTLGNRTSRGHALAALFVSALWYEFIFFGTRTLSEPIAVALILPAAALGLSENARRSHLTIAGLLLGLGVLLRFQYAVPIAILGLGCLAVDARARILPLFIGGVLAATCGAAVDLAMGMVPFKWLFINFYQNIVANQSANYGVSNPFSYVADISIWWGIATAPLLALLMIGYRHQRLLVWAAVANLGLHMMIGHKEYRFIFLTVAIFMIVAAMGSVDVALWARQRFPKLRPKLLAAILAAAWAATSAELASSATMMPRWTSFEATLKAMAKVGRDPLSCAVAIDANLYWKSGAYSRLHKNIPIYVRLPTNPADDASPKVPSGGSAFNMVIGADTLRDELPTSYRPVSCRPAGVELSSHYLPRSAHQICIFRRAGPCVTKAGDTVEQYRIENWLRKAHE
jgi:GPI mannosyltransferase 3